MRWLLTLLLLTGCVTADAEPMAGEAGWTWNSGPRVITNGEKTWAGIVDGQSGEVAVQEFPSGTITTVYSGSFEVSDHVNPSLVRLADGRLMVVMSQHNGGVWYNISTDPDDSTAWGTATEITSTLGGSSYSYPWLFRLSDAVYLFLRSGTANSASIVRATWNGSAWSSASTFMAGGIYVHMAQSVDRLHVVFTYNPSIQTTAKIWHGYWEGGQWYESDGTTVSPSAPTDLTLVQDVARPRGLDIAIGATGPVILFQHYVTFSSDSRYRYAMWDGDSWEVTELAAAGGVLDGSITFNVGGGCTDRRHPDSIVYLSRKFSGVWQMFRYVLDGSWDAEQLTAGSDDQIRPSCAVDAIGALPVLWLDGTFDGPDDFEMDLAYLARQAPSSLAGSASAWPSLKP